MKVVIFHPADKFTPLVSSGKYDCVVDLGRAPLATYEDWRRQAGCQVIGIYDFSEENEDLSRARSLAKLGADYVVDRLGIDWWSVLAPEIVPHLQQVILVHRLARYINKECDIYSTRAGYRSA